VVYALAREQGLDPKQLEEQRAAKERERGGFTTQVVLISETTESAPQVAEAAH
jgi:hypothetical protein